FELVQGGGTSQGDIAAFFGTSAITVSQKYRKIEEALGLVLLDARYLSAERRAYLEQDLGSNVAGRPLEAGARFWRPMFGFPFSSGLDAQDRIYDGWDLLAQRRLDQAGKAFRKALAANPLLADAHNGLATIAEARGDWDAALDHRRRAYELARAALGTEAPHAYMWWGELETRPYMRAREGLAWVLWQTGAYAEAAESYAALLDLNPGDNQGARYLVGPLFLLAGDTERARDAYRTYAKAYPDDTGEPHHAFNWGLTLWLVGEHEAALRRWYAAFFDNVYLAPLLLGLPQPPTDLWFGINYAWPSYADDYPDEYGRVWDRDPSALAALRSLWGDAAVQEAVQRWVEIGQEMQQVSEASRAAGQRPGERWGTLLEERWTIERQPLSEEAVTRVLDD
ncbi:MAG: tetratricopeptide repeat protein, partial [Bacteroidota bacterium]